MSFVANRFTVILDANVLVGSRKRDVLLGFHQAGLYRARWSSQILEEVWRTLHIKLQREKETVDRLIDAIGRQFQDSLVENHVGLADGWDLPDEDDRHVLSAAVRCGAQIIVTENTKDFPADILGSLDIEALTADEFLAETFDLFRIQGLKSLRDLRGRYKQPSMTPSEFIMDLRAKGLPLLAADLSDLRDFL